MIPPVASTILGLSRPTLMKLVESGEVDHLRVGTHHRIPAETFPDKLLAAHQQCVRLSRKSEAEILANLGTIVGLSIADTIRALATDPA